MHLISPLSGTVTRINHDALIRSLPSVQLLSLECRVGQRLSRTVDIRTDCGYVLLRHTDRAVLARDYATIVRLQGSIYEVEKEVEKEGEKEGEREVEKEDYNAVFERAAVEFAQDGYRYPATTTANRISAWPAASRWTAVVAQRAARR